MDIKILEEKENSLLNRKEFLLEIDSSGKTPSNKELKQELAQKLKAKPELIVIKNIYQAYGKMTSKSEVFLYNDEKSLKETETIKEKPKKEATAEQPKEQYKPKEEPPKEK